MAQIAHSLIELIGNTPLLELTGTERLQNSRTSIFDLNIRELPLSKKETGNTLETRGLTYSYTFYTNPKNALPGCRGTNHSHITKRFDYFLHYCR